MTDRTLPGIALMLGFCLTAPLIDVAAKLAAQTIPVGQVTTARFLVQGALMLPFALAMRHRLLMPRGVAGAVALRALCLVISTYSFVSAIDVMPLADALAIVYVMPFILMILGHLMFGDAVGPRRIAACVVGFAGCLLVIRPSLAAFGLVALWPLATAVSFALYMLITQGLSSRLHPVPMQLATSVAALAICLPVLWLADGTGWEALDPVRPQGLAWAWLAATGVAAAVSHMLMTWALRWASSTTLAPLNYLEIVTAVALGYLVFDDVPGLLTWAGMAVIVGSGLFIVNRERLEARASAARPSVTLPQGQAPRGAG